MLSSHALTTVAAVKELIKEESGETRYNNLLERMINASSEMIEKYCDRHFEAATYKEIHIGDGTEDLLPWITPVLEISSVKDVESSVYELLDSHLIRLEGTWQRGQKYLVEYKAGYVLPKDEAEETPRTLPYDLEDACIELVAGKFGAFMSQSAGKLSLIQEDFNVRFAQKMPESICDVLDLYRVVKA